MFKLLIAMLLLATPAMAEPAWYSKPVQCDTVDAVDQLLSDRGQYPLFAGLGISRIDDDRVVLPIIAFANLTEKSFHVVEYNIESDQACVIGIGDGLDFNVEWYHIDHINKKNDYSVY